MYNYKTVNNEWDINGQKHFCKYLKIHYELEANFLTYSHFWPSKENQRIRSWLWTPQCPEY